MMTGCWQLLLYGYQDFSTYRYQCLLRPARSECVCCVAVHGYSWQSTWGCAGYRRTGVRADSSSQSRSRWKKSETMIALQIDSWLLYASS